MPSLVSWTQSRARSLPDVEEKVACAGTALEQISFHVRGKSFLFAQRKDGMAIVRLKLSARLAEAERLAKAEPARIEVGATGWVTLRLPEREAPPKHLAAWIDDARETAAAGKAAKKVAKKARSAAPKRRPGAAGA